MASAAIRFGGPRAIDEVVRQAMADHVEAGIDQQLLLENVAQRDAVRARDQHRGQQRVREARVSQREDQRPVRDGVAAFDTKAQAEHRARDTEETWRWRLVRDGRLVVSGGVA